MAKSTMFRKAGNFTPKSSFDEKKDKKNTAKKNTKKKLNKHKKKNIKVY